MIVRNVRKRDGMMMSGNRWIKAVSLTFSVFMMLMLTIITGCAPSRPGGTTGGPSGGGGATVLPWQSSSLKIGYIRSDAISDKYMDYRDAETNLRNENRKWLEETETMEQEIRRKETELDDLALILSDERKKKLEEEVKNARKELQKFRHDTWYDESSTYVKRRKELMEPIDARVNDAIWKVSEQKNLDMVFDTIAGNIVYVKPELDITQDVLEELKR